MSLEASSVSSVDVGIGHVADSHRRVRTSLPGVIAVQSEQKDMT